MAGILDFIGNGLLPTMPSQWNSPAPYRFQLPGYLGELDKATEPLMKGYWDTIHNTNFTAPNTQPNGPSASGDMADWYPQQPQAQQQAAPQLPAWAQSPQIAAASFGMPSSSYQMGQSNVPLYGQPENPALPQNATPTGGRSQANGPINPPAQQAPSFQSELLGGSSGGNKFMDFLDAVRPGFVDRYKSQQVQSETARGLYEIYRGQGMSPNEAASRAVIEARNPAIMAERMKPYTNMEQRLANDPRMAAGGDAWNTALKWKQDTKAAETAGEVGGKSQTEAQINLPGAIADIQKTQQLLDELQNHPGRKQVGWHDPFGKFPTVPSTKGYGAERLLEQIKSRTFTDQVKTMVGMGALSNAEGAKITDAANRLDRGLSEADFNSALTDIRGTLKNGVDKMVQKSGGQAPFGFQGSAPKAGNYVWSPDGGLRQR